ncbi:hypothetical protein D3C80_1141970 [compost metagenome]
MITTAGNDVVVPGPLVIVTFTGKGPRLSISVINKSIPVEDVQLCLALKVISFAPKTLTEGTYLYSFAVFIPPLSVNLKMYVAPESRLAGAIEVTLLKV